MIFSKIGRPCSRWLRWNHVSVVNDYRDMCWRSQRLHGHGVGVVNDYADTFGKLWRFLTDFKGTISRKKVFRCVYTSNNNNLKIFKSPYLKKKLGHWLHWHPIFELCNPLSPQKRKISRNSFCLFIWGTGRIF